MATSIAYGIQFEEFFGKINKAEFGLTKPEEIESFKTVLRNAWMGVIWPVAPIATQAPVAGMPPVQTFASAKKQANGYTLFMKEKNAELKSTMTDGNARITEIRSLWKNLPASVKDGYNHSAKSEVSIGGAPVASGAKKPMNAYNLYLKVASGVLKDQFPQVPPNSRMSTVSAQWKKCTQDDKDQWKIALTSGNNPIITFDDDVINAATHPASAPASTTVAVTTSIPETPVPAPAPAPAVKSSISVPPVRK
jgi:hypothetical protein